MLNTNVTTNKQKIFLDTNIILSAINVQSTSYLLKFITDHYIFCYSDIVKKEVGKKISESKRSKVDKKNMKIAVDRFINDVQLVTVNEHPLVQQPNQSNDDFIIMIAQQSNCGSICTYNHKDFHESELQLILPTNLLRESSLDPSKKLEFTFNLQRNMSHEWSVLILFDFMGLISDLVLLEDTTENKVILEQKGTIELIRKNSIIKKVKLNLKLILL